MEPQQLHAAVFDLISKGETKMEAKDYIVIKIEGEYATLREEATNEELFIALALLPEGTDVKTRLHYEMLEYTIVKECK